MITETITNMHEYKESLRVHMSLQELEMILAQHFNVIKGTTQFEAVQDGKTNEMHYVFTWKR